MHSLRLIRNYILFLSGFLSAVSCSTTDLIERNETANKIAAKAEFQSIRFDTNFFRLHGWGKMTVAKGSQKGPLNSLIVYIEGDGLAWKSRFIRSNNPTPVNPMSLRLAAKDERMNILYLARPCQFEINHLMMHCQPKYWTSHRYSQEVIDAYNVVFDAVKKQYGISEFEIVGYSGGGVVAMLLAAQRSDVVQITTIASNLDHVAWSNYHEVSPLTGSLDVYSFLSGLTELPQLHLFGSDDSIVPSKTNEKLLKRLLENSSVHYRVVDGFDHLCCWAEEWPEIRHEAQQNKK